MAVVKQRILKDERQNNGHLKRKEQWEIGRFVAKYNVSYGAPGRQRSRMGTPYEWLQKCIELSDCRLQTHFRYSQVVFNEKPIQAGWNNAKTLNAAKCSAQRMTCSPSRIR